MRHNLRHKTNLSIWGEIMTPSIRATLLKKNSLCWDVRCMIPPEVRKILSVFFAARLILFLSKYATLKDPALSLVKWRFNLISANIETAACWYLLKIRKLELLLGPPEEEICYKKFNIQIFLYPRSFLQQSPGSLLLPHSTGPRWDQVHSVRADQRYRPIVDEHMHRKAGQSSSM